jgi:translation initiation factor 1 (eIF-1/SUI1)
MAQPDAKLSTELEAAREAAAAETQRAKDMAQAELDAKNEELKKQPAATTGADSKGLSPEVEAARQAAAVESQRAKEETQLKISLENQEQQQSRLFVTGVDSKELSPEVLAARKAAAAESQRSKEQAQAKIDAENREMKKMLAVASGADSKGKAAGKSRAGWSKVGATVRFMQSASFAQQREETLPGDALARERERAATRARLHPTEALSSTERDYWQAQAPSAFAAAGATLEIQNEMRPMSAVIVSAN